MTQLTHWRLKDFEVGAGQAEAVGAGDGDGWTSATAPGDTYLALTDAGRLAAPFDAQNEREAAWVRDREWWWRTTFAAPAVGAGERLVLTFEGLDTFATIYLNGEVIGASDNMFRETRLDVTGKAKAGAENILAVRFDPPATVLADKQMETWSIISDPITRTKRNFARKAQFGWGWDWGPSLPTVGLWRPVRLSVERAARLTEVDFTTLSISPDHSSAKVRIAVAAEAFATGAGSVIADVRLDDPDGAVLAAHTLRLADGEAGALEVTLDKPALWWTPELGAPALHAVTVTLKSGGETVDERTLKVGVRTVALDTSPDLEEEGCDFFRFVLNGVPIFARGACWIPASSYVGDIGEDHYRALLEAAVDANMNMMRIWGGGIYEHDAFYDLCDRLGLLVWQDFMFACAPYPEDDPAFVESVRLEVREQIQRLRNHPCIAMWCGNNEGQVVQGFVNAREKKSDPLLGALYYDKIMPEQVAELDPTIPYWPGSPFGGRNANSMRTGDVHSWTVWHGMPPVPDTRAVGKFDLSPVGVAYTRYAEEMGRFISEYGIQASPSLTTWKRVLPPEQLELGSAAMLHRIKDHPKNKIDAMMTSSTGLPTTLEDYVDLTQMVQAEGLKFGIEHFRRRTPHCSGSLIWQYNDCWPGVSWSLIDYYGFGKAGFYAVRRAYAPVMASFKPLDDGGMELWVVNDTLSTVTDEAVIELSTFDGRILAAQTVRFTAPGMRAGCVHSLSPALAAGAADRVLTVRAQAGAFADNRWFFAPIKDLDRTTPKLDVAIEVRGEGELAVTLRAPAFAHFAHLSVPFEETWFSDNYVDLRAGVPRTLIMRRPGGPLSAADVTASCR